MSQSKGQHPSFNLVVQEAPGQQYPSNGQVFHHNLQPWNFPRPRSVQYNMPSPTPSVRSTRTAPSQRMFDRASFQQMGLSPGGGDPVDSNLFDDLSPFGTSARVPQDHYRHDAQRYHDDSWNPYNMRSANSTHDSSRLTPLDVNFKDCRSVPESVDSYAPRSDSGYQSQSVLSNEPGQFGQDLPPGVISQISHLQVCPEKDNGPITSCVPSDQTSQVSSRSGSKNKSFLCHKCSEVLKCKSDFKKHNLKHEKPFMCNEPGCKRASQGFTTVNDLDRHKKSVHKIGVQKKSYQCASEQCRNKDKIWPRLDNFKQHIERMHKDEDDIDLIKRSVYVPRQPSTVSENGVGPMDSILVGMEKSFPNHTNYESFTTWNMIPDQEPNQWPTDTNASEVTVDCQQADISTQKTRSGIDGGWRDLPPSPVTDNAQVTGSSDNLGHHNRLHDTSAPIRIGAKSSEQLPDIPRSKLSREPHTKAQQHGQAFSKKFMNCLSKASEDSAPNFGDLEQAILRILCRSTVASGGNEETLYDESSGLLPKKEAIEAVKAISNLIKQFPALAFSQPRRSGQASVIDPKVCSVCGWAVARACDLKKHMTRHEKPYGCTYPKCNKRFGAKSDWKRHENSQHFQPEAYRCHQASHQDKICGQHFLCLRDFEKHLEEHHGFSSTEQVAEEVLRRNIGKNCQGQFWCGFCLDIIVLKTKRNAAWDERFDHIAEHFQTEKKKIEDWICAEENKKKRELLTETDGYVFDDEDERGVVDAAGEADYALASNSSHTAMHHSPAPLTARPLCQTSTLKTNGKRPLPDKSSGARKRKHHTAQSRVTSNESILYCCACGNGPYNSSIHVSCVACGHEYCASCNIEHISY